MLDPRYLDHVADDIVELYNQLDASITRDIVRRLVKAGKVTDTAAWQINRLQDSGLLYEDVVRDVAKYANASDRAVKAAFEEAGIASTEAEQTEYAKAGLHAPPIRMSESSLRILNAGMTKTNGQLRNMTMTTAITTQQAYINTATLAEMQVESGLLDYNTAIRRAVKEASVAGASVAYPSGHIDKLDVAVRRAVLTGVNQTMGQVSLQYAEEFGCDIMEITAHSGARPSHAVWQGKLVSRSGKRGYLSMNDIGYGTGAGFMGWNCRHSWNPFFPGISTPNYTREKLAVLNEKNVEYAGKFYTEYEASQMQRGMERDIRASKRELAGLDEGIKAASDDSLREELRTDFSTASVKLKRQERELSDFLDQTSRRKESARVQVQGFGQSTVQKAVWANKKAVAKSSEGAIMGSKGRVTNGLKVNIQLFGTPNYSEMHTEGLRKTVKSLGKRIEEHQRKIQNPASIYPEWKNFPEERKQREIGHWNREIERFKDQRAAAEKELKNRGVL